MITTIILNNCGHSRPRQPTVAVQHLQDGKTLSGRGQYEQLTENEQERVALKSLRRLVF